MIKLTKLFISVFTMGLLIFLIGCKGDTDAAYKSKATIETTTNVIETTTEETTIISGYNFLKASSTVIADENIVSYNGYDFSDSIVTDENEVEYAEYNANKNFKNTFYEDENYEVYYYYYSEDNKLIGYHDVYIIDKHKNAEKATMYVPNFFGYSMHYTEENILCGNILWVKLLNDDAADDLENNRKYSDSVDGYEYWQFIDLTGKNGASSSARGNQLFLSKNRKYFCRGDYKDGEHYSIIGNTSTLEHTKYKSVNGYNFITNDGTLIIAGSDGIYSIFENDNNLYNYNTDAVFLYISEDAVYAKNNYGILKYDNNGENLVIKFIDFGQNTKVWRYVVSHSNSSYILLKNNDKEEEINLDNY